MNLKLLFASLALAIGLHTCPAATETAAAAAPATPPAYGVSGLLQDTNKPWGKRIVLEGFPSAVCKRSGKKAWLRDTNSEAAGTIRVERTGAMPAFNQELVGKTLRVTGTLRELRMDAAYFDAMEARLKASLAKAKAGEDEEGCTEQCQENVAVEKALKNVAAMRAKLAKAPKGYLSALWVDGESWELAGTK